MWLSEDSARWAAARRIHSVSRADWAPAWRFGAVGAVRRPFLCSFSSDLDWSGRWAIDDSPSFWYDLAGSPSSWSDLASSPSSWSNLASWLCNMGQSTVCPCRLYRRVNGILSMGQWIAHRSIELICGSMPILYMGKWIVHGSTELICVHMGPDQHRARTSTEFRLPARAHVTKPTSQIGLGGRRTSQIRRGGRRTS